MTTYDAEPGAPAGPEHPEEPQPVEIPTEMRAGAPVAGPMPEVASHATLKTPPIIPAVSEPPPPSESRIAISISEFRGLCHTLQTLTATHSILT